MANRRAALAGSRAIPAAALGAGKVIGAGAQAPGRLNVAGKGYCCLAWRTSLSEGAQNETVEVTIKGNVLTVWRPNSNMNQSTHAGRDNEAMAIATVVSNAIVGKPEFSRLVAIWVRYVVRSRPGGPSKNVDSIEFREDPNGVFRFHQT